jgi:hypothetical protein
LIGREPITLINNGNVGLQGKGLKAAKNLVRIDRFATCFVKIIDADQPLAAVMFCVEEA